MQFEAAPDEHRQLKTDSVSLSSLVPARANLSCPHCHEQFGTASLSIHVVRCRALLPSSEYSPDSQPTSKMRPEADRVLSLVNMCLHCLTKNFSVACMDAIYRQPNEQAALVASLPMHLIHRIIINLVVRLQQGFKDLEAKRSKCRKVKQLLVHSRRKNDDLTRVHEAIAIASERTRKSEQLLEDLKMQLKCSNEIARLMTLNKKKLQASNDKLNLQHTQLNRKIARMQLKYDKLKIQYGATKKREIDTINILARHCRKTPDPACVLSITKQPSNQVTSLQKCYAAYEQPLRIRSRPSSNRTSIPLPSLSAAIMFGSTGAFAASLRRIERDKYLQQVEILQDVYDTINEMIYDVEISEFERERQEMAAELRATRVRLQHALKCQDILQQQKKNVAEYLEEIEKTGEKLLATMKKEFEQVAMQLQDKEHVEMRYAYAKEQLEAAAMISMELAEAKLEVAELRGRVSSQNRMKFSSSHEIISSSKADYVNCHTTAFAGLSDRHLLAIFSFLETRDVLAVGMLDRYIRGRVLYVFGMDEAKVERRRKSDSQATGNSTKTPRINGSQKTSDTTADLDKAKSTKVDMIVRSLKKDEMKLFHDLSTRIRTLEGNMSKAVVEREHLHDRLTNAENIRYSLLRELEKAEQSASSAVKLQQSQQEQSLIDREIITYLDAKSQGLEITLRTCAQENETLRSKLKQLKEEQEAKTEIIQDMVALLTEENKTLDGQLKTQRRVLVREVKSLRGEIKRLENEREQYQTQWKQIKQSLQQLDR